VPAIESQIEALKKALRKSVAGAGNKQAEQDFMTAVRNILTYLKQRNVYNGAIPSETTTFADFWPQIPAEIYHRNWYGFGALLLRRLIADFRRNHDPALNTALQGLLREQARGVTVTADAARAAMLSTEKPLPASLRRRYLAAVAEADIIAFRRNPDARLRASILRAVRDENIQRYIDNSFLWEFLCTYYCRKVDEAVFAGNRRDQVRSTRALTRFLLKAQKVKPANVDHLVTAIRTQLARAMLHADRPVAVGILEFLRNTQQMRSAHILQLLAGEEERLAYVNFYYWATGRARSDQWYLDKFQKYFTRGKLRLASREKGFVLEA